MNTRSIYSRTAGMPRVSGKRRELRTTRRKSSYQLVFDPTDTILDPRIVPAVITWDGGAGTLNWADANNWDTDSLPGSSDDAVIPDLSGGNWTITLNTSPTIKSLNNQEGLFVQSCRTLSITQGTSQVLGSFDLQGSLTATGNTTTFNAPSAINANSACITARSGASLTLDGVASATNLRLYSQDTGSSISLPNLTTMPSNYSAYRKYPQIEASSDGTINLPNLTAMTRVGTSDYAGLIYLSGSSSSINMPNLADLSGVDTIEVAGGGKLTLPGVTSWQTANIYSLSSTSIQSYDADSVLNLPNLASIESRSSEMSFDAYDSSLINLPALATATENGGSISFNARRSSGSGGTIQLPSLISANNLSSAADSNGVINMPLVTSVDGTSISVYSNGVINLPLLPSANSSSISVSSNGIVNMPLVTSMVGSYLSLSGANSILNVGDVTNLDSACITARSGAILTLGGVTSATNLQLTARDDGSTINLPNLTTISSNYSAYRYYPVFDAEFNGAINLPNLTAISRVGTSYSVGLIYVVGKNSSFNAPLLTDLTGVGYISVTYGGNLTLPGVTSWQTANFHSESISIRTEDANSVLSLPNLASVESRYAGMGFAAFNGGLINLPSLATATENGGSIDFLASSYLSNQGGTIQIPALTSAINLDFSAHNNSTIQLSNISTTIQGGKISVGTNSTLSGSLRLLNGARLNGVGLVKGNVINEASVSAYTYYWSADRLTIQGNYTQTSAGTLNTFLKGTTTGTQYDQLIVTGTANLSGRLYVLNSSSPSVGNSFNIISAGSVVNDFQIATVSATSNGVLLQKSVSATGVTINAVSVPVINVADTYNSEGDSTAAGGPTNTMSFVISGIAPEGGVTINYTTTGGNPGVDYTATSGNFTVPEGSYSQTIDVTLIGNQVLQDNRTFQIQASATDVPAVTGTGLIYDDDAPVTMELANASAVTHINSAFSPSPTVTVKNVNGHLVEGATVSFGVGTGPNGSSAAFEDETNAGTTVTGADGVAIAPTLTANNQAGGPYSLSISGLAFNGATASTGAMALTNEGLLATSMIVYAGADQSATVNTAFAEPLKVKALDANGIGVPGVTVTFVTPASGASGNFAVGVLTAVTGADGVATSPVFTANTVAGTYNVTASATDLDSISFGLTNSAGAATNLAYSSSSSGQSTKVGTAYALPLKSLVTDTYSNPVSGVTVTFAAPGSGASATFAGGTNTAVSGADGVATSVVLTANSVAGSYSVTASATGLTGIPAFSLTNTPDVASAVSIVAGDNQSTVVNTAFGTSLKVKVTDGNGNAVPGVTVTFAAPSTGGSGAFTGGITTAVSDDDGFATAATFTANTAAGAYSVSATVDGLTPVNFNLTNTAGAAANMAIYSGNNQSAIVTTAFTNPLAVLVTDTYGNPVSGTAVTFNAPGSGASATLVGGVNTATSNASGIATSAGLTANNMGGSYSVTATVPTTATASGFISQSFSLTNTAQSVTLFDVQKGSVGRSFVRYVDLGYYSPATVSEIVASIGTAKPRIRMINTGLDGKQKVFYNLKSKVAAIDTVLAMNFGVQGIGGRRNSAAGDGSYLIELDLDNNGSFETSRRFYRLLGDVNGDKQVTAADSRIVARNMRLKGSNLAADVNGDGVVNATDDQLVRRQLRRKIKV